MVDNIPGMLDKLPGTVDKIAELIRDLEVTLGNRW